MRAIVTSSADPQEAADENFDAGTQYLTEDTGDKPDDKGVWEDEVQKPDKHGPMVHGVPQEGTEAQEGDLQPTGGPQGEDQVPGVDDKYYKEDNHSGPDQILIEMFELTMFTLLQTSISDPPGFSFQIS